VLFATKGEGQALQKDEPAAAAMVPLRQDTQEDPNELDFPAGHNEQLVDEVTLLYLPGAHCVQDDAPEEDE